MMRLWHHVKCMRSGGLCRPCRIGAYLKVHAAEKKGETAKENHRLGRWVLLKGSNNKQLRASHGCALRVQMFSCFHLLHWHLVLHCFLGIYAAALHI